MFWKLRIVKGSAGGYKRSRKGLYKVVLKTLSNSECSSDFLKEFNSYIKCKSELEVYWITQDNKKQYLIVFQYANKEDLYKSLKESPGELDFDTSSSYNII
ncbi:9664_t:CDS:1 [Dentiscutata erythropus]|uniref:9664_t:CDS:1 n=1 Tax=Dentiscutata erythropus TaxID=1348616 RepID=A0A9N9HEQ4_9GLOM|nr:9664_t:CDS:1 [Dentiscutata erythropus]